MRDIEKVAFHLTSRKSTTALTASSTHSSASISSMTHLTSFNHNSHSNSSQMGTANPLSATRLGNGGAGGTPERHTAKRVPSTNLMEFTPQRTDSGDPEGARSKHDFNSITDALLQVESLRQELERVQMGLMLMAFSVEKLMDIVTVEPACCPNIFDFFVPRAQQSIGRDSTGLYSATESSTGSKAAGAGTRDSRLSRIAAAGARANPFKDRGIKKAGYKNIGAAGGPAMFSIESHDDEDDVM